MQWKVFKTIVIVFGLGCFSSLALATNGSDCVANNAIDGSLLDSNIADPQSSWITSMNPAGLVAVGNRVDAGVAVFNPRREYSATPGGNVAAGRHVSGSKYHPVPAIGYSRAIDENDAVGVSLTSAGGMCTDYLDSANVFGGGGAGIQMQQMFANFSYAHKLNNQFSLGGGLVAAGQSVKVRGLSQFWSFTKTQTGQNLTNEGTNYSGGGGVIVGAQWDVSKKFGLAASYRSLMIMTKFKKYSNLFAQGGGFNVPPVGSVGFAWHLQPNMTFTGKVKRIWYSAVPAMSNPIENLGKRNTDRSYALGGDNGAGFGWRDMTVFSVGWQWERDARWTWRAGYSYGKQPIRPSQVVFNVLAPAVVEQHFTAGFTRKMSQTTELSIYGMFVPRNSVSGPNYFAPAQTITLSMEQYQVGFALSLL